MDFLSELRRSLTTGYDTHLETELAAIRAELPVSSLKRGPYLEVDLWTSAPSDLETLPFGSIFEGTTQRQATLVAYVREWYPLVSLRKGETRVPYIFLVAAASTSEVEGRGPPSEVDTPRSKVEGRGPPSEVDTPRSKVEGRGPPSEVEGPRLEVEVRPPSQVNPTSEVQGPRSEVEGPRSEVEVHLRSEVEVNPPPQVEGPPSEVEVPPAPWVDSELGGFEAFDLETIPYEEVFDPLPREDLVSSILGKIRSSERPTFVKAVGKYATMSELHAHNQAAKNWSFCPTDEEREALNSFLTEKLVGQYFENAEAIARQYGLLLFVERIEGHETEESIKVAWTNYVRVTLKDPHGRRPHSRFARVVSVNGLSA